MQIRNILAGQSEQALLGKRGGSEPIGSTTTMSAEPAATPARSVTGTMAAVLANYDVGRITPSEYSEMLQQLASAGVLSQEEYQELAAVRVDLDTAGVGPDEPIDLVSFYRQLIGKLERRLDDAEQPQAIRQQIQNLRRRLDWMEKFAVVQANPDAAGIDQWI